MPACLFGDHLGGWAWEAVYPCIGCALCGSSLGSGRRIRFPSFFPAAAERVLVLELVGCDSERQAKWINTGIYAIYQRSEP